VLDALDNSEQAWMQRANRERRAYETKLRDPDDCYLEVMAREEERGGQGLTPRIGIQDIFLQRNDSTLRTQEWRACE
jgi:hypothetical protein